MSIALLRMVQLLALLAGLCATAVALTRPMVVVDLPAPRPGAGASRNIGAGPSPVHGSSDRATERPAFRADRRRSSVSFDPAMGAASDAPALAQAPRPALAVTGIVWGKEPAVIMEGLPGAEGAMVLRQGDRVAGLRVVRIERERVVIGGMDTIWRLPVRDPWK